MNATVAEQLKQYALKVGRDFSDPNREMNGQHETYELDTIHPLSEFTAAIVYLKNSGKKAICFAVYVKSWWQGFFMKTDHLLGMEHAYQFYQEVEDFNYRRDNLREPGRD